MITPLLVVIACTSKPVDSGSVEETGAPDDGLLTLATIQGNVTREVGLYGDGYGALLVTLFLEPTGGTGEPYPATERAWATHDADLADDSASIAYSLSNIFPRELPFYVAGFFFEDETIDLTNTAVPQLGDIFSDLPFREITPIEIPTGGIYELDIPLTEPIFYDPDE